MQKKFAQKLNEHNEQTSELLNVVKELTEISKNQTEIGNVELAEQIAGLAEKCTNLVGKITEAFDDEYGEEMELLQQALAGRE